MGLEFNLYILKWFENSWEKLIKFRDNGLGGIASYKMKEEVLLFIRWWTRLWTEEESAKSMLLWSKQAPHLNIQKGEQRQNPA